MSAVSLTVTIAVLDAPEATERCLSSVLKHTDDCEILVTDNGSGEDTATMLRGFTERDDRVNVTRYDENRGFIIPQNEMVARAQGDLVCVLNSDVHVYADWWLPMAKALNPLVAQIGPSGGFLRPDGSGYTNGTGPPDYVEGWCFMMKADLARQFGPFDADHLDFAYGEDADLSMRLREAGYSIGTVACNLTHQRYGSRSAVLPVNLERVRQENQQYIAWRWGHCLEDLSCVM